MTTELLEQYAGKATIIQDEREIPAEVEYRVERERIWVDDGETLPGMSSWEGDFRAKGVVTLSDAELVLPDRRSAKIFIKSLEPVEVTQLGDLYPQFVGSGIGRFVGNGFPPLVEA